MRRFKGENDVEETYDLVKKVLFDMAVRTLISHGLITQWVMHAVKRTNVKRSATDLG